MGLNIPCKKHFSILTFIYLKAERQISRWLFSSPNLCKSQGWAKVRPKSGAHLPHGWQSCKCLSHLLVYILTGNQNMDQDQDLNPGTLIGFRYPKHILDSKPNAGFRNQALLAHIFTASLPPKARGAPHLLCQVELHIIDLLGVIKEKATVQQMTECSYFLVFLQPQAVL